MKVTQVPLVMALALVVSTGEWLFFAAGQAAAREPSPLIDRTVAQRHGLDRPWFTQIALHASRSRVSGWALLGEDLFVLTDSGILQRIDTETGRTHWTARIGNPNYPSLGPAVNQDFVALVNGSTLYVLNRSDGRGQLERPVGGGPGAGPALGQEYAFVPMITGRMEGYPLNDPKSYPWFYQSFGHTMLPPVVSGQSLVWTTTEGYIYFARAAERGVRLRVETPDAFHVGPAMHDGFVYVASSIGEVYALAEESGQQRWQYAMDYPASGSPAIIADRVFVTSGKPALHCVDAKSGRGLWIAPRVLNFAAVSKTRAFGLDQSGSLVILDRETGGLLDRIPVGGSTMAVVNDQSDRVFLMTPTGLVQCLHELGAEKPTYYVDVPAAEPAAEPADGDQPAEEGAAPPTESPAPPPSTFDEPPADAEEDEPADVDPFGNEEEDIEEEDPFG